MKFPIEASVAYLPVTALQVLKRGQSTWLLASQGLDLLVLSEDGPYACVRRKIFHNQTVYGLVLVSNADGESIDEDIEILLWGGRQVRFASLRFLHKSEIRSAETLNLSLSKICEVQDHILKVINEPATITPSATALLLTAKNTILKAVSIHEDEPNLRKTSHKIIIQGPRAFLYAGDIFPVNPDLLIVASGTAFGEILLWKCSRNHSTLEWSAILQKVFLGHQGSIFGVCISEASNYSNSPQRLLASCSDDRTIRIWNISDSAVDDVYLQNTELHEWSGSDELTSLKTQSYAMTLAHFSRIWNVEFVSYVPYENGEGQYLLSQGEDANSQLWLLQHGEGETDHLSRASMQLICSDRYHVGKNIWSMTRHLIGNKIVVYTGGADGRIVSRPYPLITLDQKQSHVTNIEFRHMSLPLKALKQYHILSPESILAITDQGHLVRGDWEGGFVHWHSIAASDSRSGLMLCHNSHSHIAYVFDAKGNVTMLSPSCKVISRVSVALNFSIAATFVAFECYLEAASLLEVCLIWSGNTRPEVVLSWTVSEVGSSHTKTLLLSLPPTFVVTSAIYAKSQNTVVLGSRAGALAVFTDVDFAGDTSPQVQCYRHIHGADAVTSILLLPEARNICKPEREIQLHLLTTGRDGALAVHRVDLLTSSDKGSGFQTVHSSSTTFGSHIEGAYLIPDQGSCDSSDIVLYGFRSRDFVVWHQALDIALFEIECGGAHRSWDYKARGGSSASFAWTKAGSFNFINEKLGNQRVLQPGGHGREIKALAQNSRTTLDSGGKLVATGAEDTNIRLFVVDIDDQCRCVATLRQHTTGIQHLAFSACGNFLFSSAGCEEFMVWRLWLGVPCVEVGVTLLDVMPKNQHDRDARITNFDIRADLPKSSSIITEANFTCCLAYSNGKIKILRYVTGTQLRQGHFHNRIEIPGSLFCLTQLQISEFSRDGQLKLLSAGTNGMLNLHLVSNANQNGPEASGIVDAYRVHQSTIMTMARTQFSEGLQLIVTGGDDNALGLTFLRTFWSGKELKTLLIPKAHAATITAVNVIHISYSSAETRIDVVSGGNDQKIKFWKITLPPEVLSSNVETSPKSLSLVDVNVEKILERWTAIADVSDVQTLPTQEKLGIPQNKGEFRIMVVGVGMEILRYSINATS